MFSNIKIALLVLFNVYCLEIIACFIALKIFKKMTKHNDSNHCNTYMAIVRTFHVVALIGIIYFIPLVALVVCLAINSLLVGPIILSILGSTIFVTNKIIIPISENKRIQLYEKCYGKDSIEYKTLIERKTKNNKKNRAYRL